MERIGPYEILERLGAGGMGTVYRARHTETGKLVALKVMRADVAEDAAFVRRFQREAQIAQTLRSPNIVETLDAGVEDGTPYIAMDLVEGETLASHIRRSGPLPVEEAVDIATQVARGLQAAYEAGVIHRDISPQNILLTPDGTAKIADFGIARSQAFATMTATAAFIGKPAYAAPETIEGTADIRSDIYSLGVVLFEMLTGRPMFIGPTPLAVMQMHVQQPPPSLAAVGVRVPQNIEVILGRCLEKDPARRYQTPSELAAALAGGALPRAGEETIISPAAEHGATILTPPGGSGRPPPGPPSGGAWRRGPFTWMTAAALVGFAVVVASLLAILGDKSSGDEAAPNTPGPSVTAGPSAAPLASSGGTRLAIDAGPAGNEPNSLAEIEDCVSVDVGDQFQIDIVIEDVADLFAWEVLLEYEPDILTVIEHDVMPFLGANPGSAPIDTSSSVPDTSGYHTLSAIEMSDPPIVSSGSGVLARVTLEATANGSSQLAFGDAGGTQMPYNLYADVPGDASFAVEAADALAVVGGDCPPGSHPAVTGGTTFDPAGDVESEQTPPAASSSDLVSAADSPPSISGGETVTTASGLQYIMFDVGSGATPADSDTVTVDYTGWIAPDGPKFDSSVDRGVPSSFQVSGVILGFAEGLQLMREGGTMRMIIPPELGYGESGAGDTIPPGSTLILDVHLIEIE